MPGPSSRTVTVTPVGLVLDEQPGPASAVAPGVVDRGTDRGGQLTGGRGGQQHGTGGRRELHVGAGGQQDPQVGLARGHGRGAAADEAAQRDLLLGGQARELRVGRAARHQRERLQHPVVHRARQPLPLRRRAAQGDGLGVGGRGAPRERDDVADDHAEQQEQDEAVHRRLREPAALEHRPGPDDDRGGRAAPPAGVHRPREHRRGGPADGQRRIAAGDPVRLQDEHRAEQRRDRQGQVQPEQRPSGRTPGVGARRSRGPDGHPGQDRPAERGAGVGRGEDRHRARGVQQRGEAVDRDRAPQGGVEAHLPPA
jgi:hypothetical protein